MKEQLKKFIAENNLQFNEGSGGDSNILAITGYSTYIGATIDDLLEAVNSTKEGVNSELDRVFSYAKKNNYAAYWKTAKAKVAWKF
tara:strand:- start:165 stop:422 length:258 start_codon:yes stop_codon:yes gene_type:complete